MKKLKIVFFIICILSVLFVLTGCGKEKTKKEVSSDYEAYGEALEYIYEENYDEAYKVISKYTDSKDKCVQYLLGDSYYYGYGVEKDYKTAFSWYMKATEQGNRICQYNVGLFYAGGYGVEKNADLGKEWLKKSAIQGYENAIDYLIENY